MLYILARCPDRMGDSITEGTIKAWSKQVGERVAVDEVVCVIETDKVGRVGSIEVLCDCPVRQSSSKSKPPTMPSILVINQVSVDIRAQHAGVLVEQYAHVDDTVR